jgi:hypothetical protein
MDGGWEGERGSGAVTAPRTGSLVAGAVLIVWITLFPPVCCVGLGCGSPLLHADRHFLRLSRSVCRLLDVDHSARLLVEFDGSFAQIAILR